MRMVLLSLCLLVAACGFRPLHGQSYRAEQVNTLSSVTVTVDHTRRGQLLEAEIGDATNPDAKHSPKLYHLAIALTESEIGLFINPDGTSSRSDILMNTKYTLTRLSDNKVMDSGAIQRISSYNTSEQADYASYVSVEDAKKRGIIELAQDYKLRMANVLAQLAEKNQ